MRSERTKKLDISPEVRKKVRDRDCGCIFCNYLWDRYRERPTGMVTQIAHFIGRGRGGLGIEENLAVACLKHHQQLDQGDGEELRLFFKEYLDGLYPEFKDEDRVYKWHLSIKRRRSRKTD